MGGGVCVCVWGGGVGGVWGVLGVLGGCGGGVGGESKMQNTEYKMS